MSKSVINAALPETLEILEISIINKVTIQRHWNMTKKH